MWRTRLGLLLALYLLIVAAFVLGPNPGPLVGKGVRKAHRIEFAARAATHTGSTTSVAPTSKQGLVRGLSADDLGNIALFVPFGLLFPAAFPRRRRWVIPLGIAISAAIELSQLAFLPWRVSSTRDVWWNGFGTACGLLMFLVIDTVMRRRRASASTHTSISA